MSVFVFASPKHHVSQILNVTSLIKAHQKIVHINNPQTTKTTTKNIEIQRKEKIEKIY